MREARARLAALERAFKPAGGARTLVLLPDISGRRDDEPRVTLRGRGRGHLAIRYPEGMGIDEDDLDGVIAALVPSGPDRDRLVRKGQGASAMIVVLRVELDIDGLPRDGKARGDRRSAPRRRPEEGA